MNIFVLLETEFSLTLLLYCEKLISNLVKFIESDG